MSLQPVLPWPGQLPSVPLASVWAADGGSDHALWGDLPPSVRPMLLCFCLALTTQGGANL